MLNIKNKMPTAKSGGRKLKNDLILLSAFLLAILVLGMCLYLFNEPANAVIVTIDGNIFGTYSIEKNTTVDINSGENNDEINRLVIQDGKAYISFATCPDGICANHRPISRTGESIICLPHKIVISTESNFNITTPDIVA